MISALAQWDAQLAQILTREVIEAAVATIPEEFIAVLLPETSSKDTFRFRAAYVGFLWKRLTATLLLKIF